MAGDNNRIHEEAAMWVLPFFGKHALPSTLNGRMSQTTHIASVVASLYTAEPTTQKNPLCSYLEAVNYLLKKVANDQAIAEMDPAMLRYTQPAKTTLVKFADDLYDKSCKSS